MRIIKAIVGVPLSTLADAFLTLRIRFVGAKWRLNMTGTWLLAPGS